MPEVSTVTNRRYQGSPASSVSPGALEPTVAGAPELQRVGVDHGGAGAVADEALEQFAEPRRRQ